MSEKPDLSSLLGSRICHDLISPLGAIGNGVELLMMSGAAASPEVALIAESVASANARIRYFRVAYGLAGSEQRMGRPEIVSILNDTTKGGRLTIDWQAAGDVPRPDVKAVFLMLQCCETAMPYGGRITVTRDAPHWRVHAAAQKLKTDTALWDTLSNPAHSHDISAAHVHFAMLPDHLLRHNRSLAVEMTPTDITLTF